MLALLEKKVRIACLTYLFVASCSLNSGFRLAPQPNITLPDKQATLETEQIFLRPFTSDDAHVLFAIHADPNVTQFLPFDPDETVDETRKRIERYLKGIQTGESHFWAIELKRTGTIIGRCGFYNIQKKSGSVEWLFLLSPARWNQGIGSEVLRACSTYAFQVMNCNRIHATAYSHNIGSIKACLRAGFTLVGLIEEYQYYKGAFWDRVLLSLTRQAFERAQARKANETQTQE